MKERWVWVLLFVVFALYGTFMEWVVGVVWSRLGTCPYVYPRSPLLYTDLKMLPLWGVCGLQGVAIYLLLKERKLSRMLHFGLLLAITFVIVILAGVFAG